jgi:hypothetical protein
VNRNKLIYVFAAIVVVVAGLVYFLNRSDETDVVNSNNNEPPYSSSKWDADVKLGNKDPYGLYVFEELLIAHGKFTQFNDYSDYKLLDSITKVDSSLYMYVGIEFTLTDDETDELLEGIARGNQLFLSVESQPKYLYDELFDEGLMFEPQDSAVLATSDSSYSMYYIQNQDTLTELWDLFNPNTLEYVDTVHTESFDMPMYVEVPYGEGSILLHLNPVIFTNYQLLRPAGKEYFKSFVKTLDQPHIQWLSFAKYEPIEYDDFMNETPPDNSLLSELFKYPPFKWAFIIAIFGLLLYFLFRSKRERPIIPAFQDSKNSGFAYVDTLAGIYFQGNHSTKVLKLMRRNFYDAVYKKFYIDLSKRKSNKPIIALAQKSGVSQKEIEYLLKLLETKVDISDNFISKTYQAQRNFYFNSDIWSSDDKKKLDEQFSIIHRSNTQALTLVFSGILLILFGFILLSSTIGWGILLWPVGIITLAIGGRMLGHPIIKMNNKVLIYQPLFGKSVHLNLSQIEDILRDGDLLKLHLRNGKIITINLQNVGVKYRQYLIDFKTNLNKADYGR